MSEAENLARADVETDDIFRPTEGFPLASNVPDDSDFQNLGEWLDHASSTSWATPAAWRYDDPNEGRQYLCAERDCVLVWLEVAGAIPANFMAELRPVHGVTAILQFAHEHMFSGADWDDIFRPSPVDPVRWGLVGVRAHDPGWIAVGMTCAICATL